MKTRRRRLAGRCRPAWRQPARRESRLFAARPSLRL